MRDFGTFLSFLRQFILIPLVMVFWCVESIAGLSFDNNTTILFKAESSPVISDSLSFAKPIGLGAAISDGDTIDVNIGLASADVPVDIYVAVSAPEILSDIYLFLPGGGFSPLANGFVPWRQGEINSFEDTALAGLPLSQLAAVEYTFYFFVTPAGDMSRHYLWATTWNPSRMASVPLSSQLLPFEEAIINGKVATLPYVGAPLDEATPIQNSSVNIIDIFGTTVGAATSGVDGRFSIDDLPSGYLETEVRVPGNDGVPDTVKSVTSYPGAVIDFSDTYTISRDQATSIATTDVPAYARILGSQQPLLPGTVVMPMNNQLPSTGRFLPFQRTLASSEWLFFVDLVSDASYGHAVAYRLVDSETGYLTIVNDLMWPPLVNDQLLWDGEGAFYQFSDLDIDDIETEVATVGYSADETSDIVQQPTLSIGQQPRRTAYDEVEMSLKSYIRKHNTDPGSVFVLVWNSKKLSADPASNYDARRMRRSVINAGVSYQNVDFVNWEDSNVYKDAKSSGERISLIDVTSEEKLQPYLDSFNETEAKIVERLEQGLHSTLVLYIVSHSGGGDFQINYWDPATKSGSYVSLFAPALSFLATTKACRVRILLENCFSYSFIYGNPDYESEGGLKDLFEQTEHDVYILGAAGPDEYSYSRGLANYEEFGGGPPPGSFFTRDMVGRLDVSGGDLSGLLNSNGTGYAVSEVSGESWFNLPLIGKTSWQKSSTPQSWIRSSDPSWCEDSPGGIIDDPGGGIDDQGGGIDPDDGSGLDPGDDSGQIGLVGTLSGSFAHFSGFSHVYFSGMIVDDLGNPQAGLEVTLSMGSELVTVTTDHYGEFEGGFTIYEYGNYTVTVTDIIADGTSIFRDSETSSTTVEVN